MCVCVCVCARARARVPVACAVAVPTSSIFSEIPSTCAFSCNDNYYRPIFTKFDTCKILVNTLYIKFTKMRSAILRLLAADRRTDMVTVFTVKW